MKSSEKRKVLLLSDPNSVHTQRWALGLALRGFEIHIVGLGELTSDHAYLKHPDIYCYDLGVSPISSSDKDKLAYLKALPRLRSLVKSIQPHLVHAHYITSYGLLGALSGKKPLLLSVWGDDVLIFPKKSFIHRALVMFNLLKADYVFSTSKILTETTRFYSPHIAPIIPFGIDINKMKAMDANRSQVEVLIGTIKSLEDIYGIDYLLEAFALLKSMLPYHQLRLMIVGKGSKEKELKQFAERLGISRETTFVGGVPHTDVVKYQNMLDIYVALSRSESFGVAPLEAQACEKPVVVSDVGGLPEVIDHGVTGFVVPSGDVKSAAEALKKLVLHPDLRLQMGRAGRERVERLYNWDKNVDEMAEWYSKIIGPA